MKSKLIVAFLALCLAFINTGCEDYLDVNHNPNTLEEIPDPNILLPSAEVGLANQLMGWDFGFGGAYWTQYWTQNYTASQFKTLCNYEEQEFGTAYTALTAGVLNDLNRVLEITKDDESQLGAYFIAEALSIYTWQVITDVWGDIPYSEALCGGEAITSPVFDSQQSIYTDLTSRINALLQLDMSNAYFNGTYDLVFAGDMDKWIQFANSLKLKLMLRLSETSGYNNADVLSFIQNGNFLQESAKIDGSTWSDSQEGKRHPMREYEQGGAAYLSTNVIACKSFLDYLFENNDARLTNLFTPAGGRQWGAFFGDYESNEDSDGNGTPDDQEDYSTANIPADLDIMFISLWEVNFNIAEVYARANDFSTAKTYYDLGVAASLAQHGVGTAIIEDGGYAVWTASATEAAIKQIGMQRWVAFANYQHIESFLERNRTKYPSVNEINIAADRSAAFASFPIGDLTISVKGRALLNGNLPASPIYPSAVINRNVNAPAQKVNVGERVWWNTKTGK